MEQQDIRWKQRFQNFEKAFSKFEEAALQEVLNELERNGLIQRFEFTLELAWKVLKDYMEYQGFQLASVTPKSVVKEAFLNNLISDAEVWLTALEWRNKLSHDYGGEYFEAGEKLIRIDFYAFLKTFHRNFLQYSLVI